MHGPTCIFWANLTPFSLKGELMLGYLALLSFTVPMSIIAAFFVFIGALRAFCLTPVAYQLPPTNPYVCVSSEPEAAGSGIPIV
jgi:hypothetical protein